MYVPKHFEESREDEINRIIKNFPLATIVHSTKNGLVANHIPLLLNVASNNQKMLIGHIAKNNTLHKEIINNNVLVIFQSEDVYISPNWYPTRNKKREHVPTWNYQSVHFNGTIEFNNDKNFLLKTVRELTFVFEKENKNVNDWNIDKVTEKFMSTMLNEIMGIKIIISKQVAKSKLSQNREKEDRKNVHKEIKNSGFNFLSNSMKQL
jgi:transcriptional regulator